MDYILSIETAFGGGSIAILANRKVLDEWEGKQEISKAEDVLEQIATLLSRHEIYGNQIKKIIISSGVGSSTGEKIGKAIAKGLAKAVNCQITQVSTHQSFLKEFVKLPEGKYLTAIQNGKGGYDCQFFNIKDSAEIEPETKKMLRADELFNLRSLDNSLTVLLSDNISDLKVENFRTLAAVNGRQL